jgi:hypothetical protein
VELELLDLVAELARQAANLGCRRMEQLVRFLPGHSPWAKATLDSPELELSIRDRPVS